MPRRPDPNAYYSWTINCDDRSYLNDTTLHAETLNLVHTRSQNWIRKTRILNWVKTNTPEPKIQLEIPKAVNPKPKINKPTE